jgi:hypothetical protein
VYDLDQISLRVHDVIGTARIFREKLIFLNSFRKSTIEESRITTQVTLQK